MTRLQISNLSVRLDRRLVLDGIDITFSSGQVTAIVGPNGVGKSTLLSCLSGLRTPCHGNIFLDEKPLSYLSSRERAQKIAFIPQNPEIAWAIDTQTVVELGRTPYTSMSGLTAADHKAVKRAMAKTSTDTLAKRDVTTLSGGERARVILARALAGEPEWLLADEPFAGLDPRHQLEVAEMFRAMAHQDGKGVITTLHDLSLAARMADVIIVMAAGKIAVTGSVEEALHPDILAETYNVRARIITGESGPLIEIVGPTTG